MLYMVRIYVGEVEALTQEEAYKKALRLLEDLSGSNYGSEVMANADPEVELI